MEYRRIHRHLAFVLQFFVVFGLYHAIKTALNEHDYNNPRMTELLWLIAPAFTAWAILQAWLIILPPKEKKLEENKS